MVKIRINLFLHARKNDRFYCSFAAFLRYLPERKTQKSMENDTKMYSHVCRAVVDGEAWRRPGISFHILCKKMGVNAAQVNIMLIKELGYTGDGLISHLRKQELWGFLFGRRLETL